jgi:hypothetical protein
MNDNLPASAATSSRMVLASLALSPFLLQLKPIHVISNPIPAVFLPVHPVEPIWITEFSLWDMVLKMESNIGW